MSPGHFAPAAQHAPLFQFINCLKQLFRADAGLHEETDALRRFTSEAPGPVNVARLPQMPSLAELAAAGVARVSWGPFLHLDAMARFSEQLASLQE